MSVKVRFYSFLKKYVPFLLERGRAVKKKIKRRELENKKKNSSGITKEMLLYDLQVMGIKKGDNIMVHSSLSNIGYVDGGAKTVVDTLFEAIGTEGTMMMPAFAHSTFSKYYLDSNPVFDIMNSPSKAGAVTEEFRKRKNTLRSFHPTDSVCANGPLAEYLTNSHFNQITPYNEQSPYYKFALHHGKILNIGVPLNTSCTNLHTLEDAVDFKFPIYHSKIYAVKMLNEKGEVKFMRTKVHDPAFSQKRKPDALIPVFEKDGVLKHYTFGEAKVLLADAKGLFDSMLKNYHEKGITMYTPYGE